MFLIVVCTQVRDTKQRMEGVSIMRTKVIIALVFTALLLSLAIVPAAMASDPEPGTAPAASSFATSASSSLAPVVTETGKITLSLDAAGNNEREFDHTGREAFGGRHCQERLHDGGHDLGWWTDIRH